MLQLIHEQQLPWTGVRYENEPTLQKTLEGVYLAHGVPPFKGGNHVYSFQAGHWELLKEYFNVEGDVVPKWTEIQLYDMPPAELIILRLDANFFNIAIEIVDRKKVVYEAELTKENGYRAISKLKDRWICFMVCQDTLVCEEFDGEKLWEKKINGSILNIQVNPFHFVGVVYQEPYDPNSFNLDPAKFMVLDLTGKSLLKKDIVECYDIQTCCLPRFWMENGQVYVGYFVKKLEKEFYEQIRFVVAKIQEGMVCKEQEIIFHNMPYRFDYTTMHGCTYMSGGDVFVFNRQDVKLQHVCTLRGKGWQDVDGEVMILDNQHILIWQTNCKDTRWFLYTVEGKLLGKMEMTDYVAEEWAYCDGYFHVLNKRNKGKEFWISTYKITPLVVD